MNNTIAIIFIINGAILAIGFTYIFIRTELRQRKASREIPFAIAVMRIREELHYPECWDTATYPTLHDAIKEIGCNNPECTHKHQEK